MEKMMELMVSSDDLQVEYEVLPALDLSDPQQVEIWQGLSSVERRLTAAQEQIDRLNADIDRLTNHADGIDYTIAVASGILCGLIDSFFVGAFDADWGHNFVNEKVKDIAKNKKIEDKIREAEQHAKKKNKTLSEETKKKIKERIEQEFTASGDTNGGEDDILKKAILYLEKSKLPGDNIFAEAGNGITPSSHHLDDLAHHPTPAGLICSIVMQFTQTGIYQNSEGTVMKVHLTDKGVFGTDFPSKIFCGTVNWFFHLMSDMAGSHQTPGAGMGIPGPIISLAKELAMLPIIRKTPLPKLLDYLFNVKRFDLRDELTLGHELGKQAIPVIINDVIVRGFYFIRRLTIEFKDGKTFENINWDNVIPARNRTIVRMLTIATGTFTAVDLADAAIRAAKDGAAVSIPTFLSAMVLRVNFVGIGRFALAIGEDIGMGIKKGKLERQRMKIMGEQLDLLNAKVYYKTAMLQNSLSGVFDAQKDMWSAAENTTQTLIAVYQCAEISITVVREDFLQILESMERVVHSLDAAEEKNPGLKNDLANILKWGKKR